MTSSDPDFERLKGYDFADAKPAAAFAHLAKLRLEKQHRLNVMVDDDLATWLVRDIAPEKYDQVMNAALREFKKKRAA